MGGLDERAQVQADARRKEIRYCINKLLDDVESTSSITEYEAQAARLYLNVIVFIKSHEYRIKQQNEKGS